MMLSYVLGGREAIARLMLNPSDLEHKEIRGGFIDEETRKPGNGIRT
jgi:hypothetical protein